MRRTSKLPELLSPAGSPEALYAAVAAGADAVYLGGRHSARAYAKNFDEAALADGVRYAHLHGVRVYIALNTLMLDRELPDFLSYAESVAATGVDAAIVADRGVMAMLRRHLPSLPLHASTQAFIHNTDTANYYAARGAERVVVARELSLEAIRRITAEATPEIEVFAHGALCVSHSGQCLFSSLVGGRSGNRGECAQPCRLPYGGDKYPLSLSDLALAEHIPALIDSGVASLKIEGRMKSPSYVGGVTRIYRRLLDEGRAATRDEMAELAVLFSRGGFTDRYFVGRHHEPMTGIRTEAAKAETREREENFTIIPKTVQGVAEIHRDRPATLTLTLGERSVTVTGDIPAEAKSAPLDEGEVRRRLLRLGGSPLTMTEEGLTVHLDEGLFLPAGALNALRRAAVEALLDTHRPVTPTAYTPPVLAPSASNLPHRVAYCRTAGQARAAAASGFFDRLYLPLATVASGEGPGDCGAAMPPVITDAERPTVLRELEAAVAAGCRYALCESYGQIPLVRAAGLLPVGGHRLNVTNAETVAALLREGVEDILLSPELTAPRIAALGQRVIAYGRIPLMLTERCFVRDGFGCRACGNAHLTDRRGVAFPLMREWEHRTVVLNSLPTYLADRPSLLREAGAPRELYLFTIETEKECARILAAARAGQPLDCRVRRLPT